LLDTQEVRGSSPLRPTAIPSAGGEAVEAPLIVVRDLTVTLALPEGEREIVSRFALELSDGETLAVVGANGAGKSSAMLAMLGLLSGPPSVNVRVAGTVRFRGTELLGADTETLRRVRAEEFGIAFEDAVAAMDPLVRVGAQFAESFRRARPGVSRAELQALSVSALGAVGVPEPELRVSQFPEELSHGVARRVMLAMALAHDPTVLIADEPVGGLDGDGRTEVLDLLRERRRAGRATILLVRDAADVGGLADRVVTIPSGGDGAAREPQGSAGPRSRPQGSVEPLRPDLGMPQGAPRREVLRCEGVRVHLPVRSGRLRREVGEIRAVDGVDLTVHAGEIVGLVGRSPSGKSVLGRAVARQLRPTGGSVRVLGQDITSVMGRRLRDAHRRVKYLEGAAASRGDGHRTVRELLEHAAGDAAFTGERDRRWLAEVLAHADLGGLDQERRIEQLPAVDRTLVQLAVALVTRPAVLVIDEPTLRFVGEACDRIVAVLGRLPRALGLGILLISNDRVMVEQLADRVLTMRDGVLVEPPSPARD